MASVHYAPQSLRGIPDGAGLIRRPALALQRAAERLVYARKPTGKLLELADHAVHVRIDNMQIVEDVHMILDHLMMYILAHCPE